MGNARGFVVLLCLSGLSLAAPDAPYGKSEKVCELANRKVNESSGVAASGLRDGVFWTHNDSGDRARIYAFDATGRDLGSFLLTGVEAVDWEDMAAFRKDGKSYLLLADVGDNNARRESYSLHIVEEPAVKDAHLADAPLRPLMRIDFRYEDGKHNCESVAVDVTEGKIFLLTKEFPVTTKVYELALPPTQPREPMTARALCRVSAIFATSMDISPDGRQAAVLMYRGLLLYEKKPKQNWAEAFAQRGRSVSIPRLPQAEAVCFSRDGSSLYLTSEKAPTPLWRLFSPRASSQEELTAHSLRR